MQLEFSNFRVIMSSTPMINVKVKIKKTKQVIETNDKKKNGEGADEPKGKKTVAFNDERPTSPLMKTVYEIITKP